MTSSAHEDVLAILAKEWVYSGPPGIMNISDIVAVLPLAPSEAFAALKDLFTDGLVDMDALKTSAFLTPEGFAAAESIAKGERWPAPVTES